MALSAASKCDHCTHLTARPKQSPRARALEVGAAHSGQRPSVTAAVVTGLLSHRGQRGWQGALGSRLGHMVVSTGCRSTLTFRGRSGGCGLESRFGGTSSETEFLHLAVPVHLSEAPDWDLKTPAKNHPGPPPILVLTRARPGPILNDPAPTGAAPNPGELPLRGPWPCVPHKQQLRRVRRARALSTVSAVGLPPARPPSPQSHPVLRVRVTGTAGELGPRNTDGELGACISRSVRELLSCCTFIKSHGAWPGGLPKREQTLPFIAVLSGEEVAALLNCEREPNSRCIPRFRLFTVPPSNLSLKATPRS